MTIPYASLDPEQLDEIDWLGGRTETIFVAPCGFGKTIAMLTAIQEMREAYGDWKVLLFSTKNIVELTWPKEIRDWEHIDLTYGACTGAAAQKRKALAALADVDILGVNFESIEWYYDQVDKGVAPDREILVIDESSKMKSHSANRVKRHAGGVIRKKKDGRQKNIFFGGYVKRYKRRYAMSATPCPETYAELFGQEICISTKRRLGENITAFNETYGTPKHGYGRQYEVKEADRLRIEDKLSGVMRLTRYDDYEKLPPPIHELIDIPWSDQAFEDYKILEKHLEVALSKVKRTNLIMDKVEIEVANAGAKLNKLRQLCSGFAYDDRKNTHYSIDADAKALALDGVIERVGGMPVLVFTQYIAEAEYLRERYPKAQIGMPNDLDAWHACEIPMMVLHPASAGHGLNLQSTNIGVFYSMPYSYEQWFQAWKRLHRRGQTNIVTIFRFERENSVEKDVYDSVQSKDARLSTFLKRMRARRNAYA